MEFQFLQKLTAGSRTHRLLRKCKRHFLAAMVEDVLFDIADHRVRRRVNSLRVSQLIESAGYPELARAHRGLLAFSDGSALTKASQADLDGLLEKYDADSSTKDKQAAVDASADTTGDDGGNGPENSNTHGHRWRRRPRTNPHGGNPT